VFDRLSPRTRVLFAFHKRSFAVVVLVIADSIFWRSRGFKFWPVLSFASFIFFNILIQPAFSIDNSHTTMIKTNEMISLEGVYALQDSVYAFDGFVGRVLKPSTFVFLDGFDSLCVCVFVQTFNSISFVIPIVVCFLLHVRAYYSLASNHIPSTFSQIRL
jgi:hypothetical protein